MKGLTRVRSMTNDENVTIWPCPQCDGSLIRRKNNLTKEAFLGCTNFPKCKYTQPDEKSDDLEGMKDAASVWE
jgi:ssDNA-binding Zn-finger/Zn-ribbon topoisomerase 1